MTPREAAYLALASFERIPIDECLEEWSRTLSFQDLALAREIAAGTTKRMLTLGYVAKKVQRKLGLKMKERRLLYSALYQFGFMDKIPLYAIVNETTEIAKKYFGSAKAKFFNAYLRKLEKFTVSLPHKKNAFDLSIRLSYPPYFIKRMIEEYGMKKTLPILEVMNQNFDPMLRVRKKLMSKKGLQRIEGDVFQMTKKGMIASFAKDPSVYIQNVTPYILIKTLSKKLKKPKRILDLCASPGGKSIYLHDLYPQADLVVNDVSERKIKRLKSNFEKYNIDATYSVCPAEKLQSVKKFDLIIADVPCSNSGVLHKRCEARWRLTPEYIQDLSDLQADILENAESLLETGGEIWYMTCSILQDENEETIEFAKSLGLTVREIHKVLPDKKGFDGGFAVAFVKGPVL